jgi:hypothetical protein
MSQSTGQTVIDQLHRKSIRYNSKYYLFMHLTITSFSALVMMDICTASLIKKGKLTVQDVRLLRFSRSFSEDTAMVVQVFFDLIKSSSVNNSLLNWIC